MTFQCIQDIKVLIHSIQTPHPPPWVCGSLRNVSSFELAIVTDLNNAPPLSVTAVDWYHEMDWRKITRLDCLEQPRLSEKEFFGLFAKCKACGLVVAHLVFHCHYYSLRPVSEDCLELTDCEE